MGLQHQITNKKKTTTEKHKKKTKKNKKTKNKKIKLKKNAIRGDHIWKQALRYNTTSLKFQPYFYRFKTLYY